ncbi:FAD-dependent monooxygenase [Candidatus Poriferisodalis sp.]|uniref:FAD-dependent monooxygenase n=1 Tax=Candidatus Poriferisodalis sp. TaxID=3101277 RepID=UPI003B516B48
MSGTLPDRQHYGAIIVGGGPVGSVASLHLARAGMAVALIEEFEHPYPYPRAVMFDAYSCAILAEILGDDFGRISLKRTPRAGYYLDKDNLDEPFAHTALEVGDTRNWFVQPQVEDILRDVVGQTDNIDTFYGWSARKLYTEGESQLTIEELSSRTMHDLSSTYLLGCDGANSFVRKQAGGSLTQLGDNVSFLVIDAISAPEHRVGDDGCAYQIVDQQRPTTYLPMGVENHVRWEFRINPGDDILEIQSPERIREFIAPFSDPDHTELLRHTVYKFNSLIANRWRFGNVFLCGDAAHQTSPFLGQGLNMGIRNTRNLCQKIELVAAAAAPSSLLDRYQAECYEDTKGTIKEALKMGKLLFNTSPPANALRATISRLRRGKPIDITAQIAPTARSLELADDVPPRLRKLLPRVRVEPDDGPSTFLTLLHPERAKIIADGPLAATAFGSLDSLPESVRPALYAAVDAPHAQTMGQALVLPDIRQRIALFGDTTYVAMLENSVLLGRFAAGDERAVRDAYRAAFQLTVA